MIRRPPRSTLFPTRRSSDLMLKLFIGIGIPYIAVIGLLPWVASVDRHLLGVPFIYRSEEHTSELQSRLHLVCRLLLEKKNKHRRHFHVDFVREALVLTDVVV